MSKVLVLGALGNVGAQVMTELQGRGIAVRAGDIAPAKLMERFGAPTDAVLFDFAQPATFAPAFAGIDKMFLMRPPHIADVKTWMFPAIDAAKAAGVQHIVFLSLIGIEQIKRAPHYAVEQYLRASGMAFTFLRCSFFMQNLNTTHRAEIRDRDEIYVPVGRAKTSFIDVRDIGAAAAVALGSPHHANRVYALTGAQALDYFAVAEIFSRVLGRPITYKNPSPAQFFWRQLRQGAAPMYAVITTWLYNNTRNGMAEQITDDVQHLLGRAPIAFEQYVRDYRAAWVR